jgi:hypothetical protein
MPYKQEKGRICTRNWQKLINYSHTSAVFAGKFYILQGQIECQELHWSSHKEACMTTAGFKQLLKASEDDDPMTILGLPKSKRDIKTPAGIL